MYCCICIPAGMTPAGMTPADILLQYKYKETSLWIRKRIPDLIMPV